MRTPSDGPDDTYLRLVDSVRKGRVLLLLHNRYRGIVKQWIYMRCLTSRTYFERAYEEGKAILQVGSLGPRLGAPIPWTDALGESPEEELPSVATTVPTLREFAERIREYEDLLFGTRLFFEGVCQLYRAQPAVLELNRRRYEETRERGQRVLAQAKRLLREAQRDPQRSSQLVQFRFPPWTDEMRQRARILVDAYRELFPGRDGEEPLTAAEHRALMELASDRL